MRSVLLLGAVAGANAIANGIMTERDSCEGGSSPKANTCYAGRVSLFGQSEAVVLRVNSFEGQVGEMDLVAGGIVGIECTKKDFIFQSQKITPSWVGCMRRGSLPRSVSLPLIEYCSKNDVMRLREDGSSSPLSYFLKSVSCPSVGSLLNVPAPVSEMHVADTEVALKGTQLASDCKGNGVPKANSCYAGKAGFLGISEAINVKVDSIADGKGTMDLLGKGVLGLNCTSTSFSYADQKVTPDFHGCLPGYVTVPNIEYCSDDDVIHLTVKDTNIPVPISATMKSVACPEPPSAYKTIAMPSKYATAGGVQYGCCCHSDSGVNPAFLCVLKNLADKSVTIDSHGCGKFGEDVHSWNDEDFGACIVSSSDPLIPILDHPPPLPDGFKTLTMTSKYETMKGVEYGCCCTAAVDGAVPAYTCLLKNMADKSTTIASEGCGKFGLDVHSWNDDDFGTCIVSTSDALLPILDPPSQARLYSLLISSPQEETRTIAMPSKYALAGGVQYGCCCYATIDPAFMCKLKNMADKSVTVDTEGCGKFGEHVHSWNNDEFGSCVVFANDPLIPVLEHPPPLPAGFKTVTMTGKYEMIKGVEYGCCCEAAVDGAVPAYTCLLKNMADKSTTIASKGCGKFGTNAHSWDDDVFGTCIVSTNDPLLPIIDPNSQFHADVVVI